MYIEVTKSMFHDMFRQYNRLDNFSYAAREALFDYLEECEESTDTKIELDIIALCCDYMEDSIENVLKEYNLESFEELQQETLVIWHDDENVLYESF